MHAGILDLVPVGEKSPMWIRMEQLAEAARIARAKAQLIPLRDIASVETAKAHRARLLPALMHPTTASEVFVPGQTYAYAVGGGEMNALTFVKEEVIPHLGVPCLFFDLLPRIDDLPLFVCRRSSFETDLFRFLFAFPGAQALYDLDLGGVQHTRRARSRTPRKRPTRKICYSIPLIRAKRKAALAKKRREASRRRK